ncbi:thiaminase II [Saliterribacillus persicus]|uniref:Aminopyrimidine aminohydrolase n=1 Tax=Saliterribacillus persicus TaxID=930114 RepID=A0A368X4X5_9BACI|nr:thiaminase II [Saliterribacillus persicus]RCW62749.1 thiaminase/transcriptional activator TenA [Saliterribacillus persicus]
MSFSKDLRNECDHLFKACYDHPFVQGIAKGELNKEQLIHYVKQDYEYLNAMIQARAYGMAKCTNREDMEMFNTSISFILNSETHPHHNFCQIAGVNYDDLQGYSLAPTAKHYASHMLQVSQVGSLGEVIAVTLPCPWIYLYVAERMMQEVKPDENHPFYDWISFYGAQEEPRMNVYLDRLDELAENASASEKEKMREHFFLSCQLEYMFFDMAYKVQEWPVQK